MLIAVREETYFGKRKFGNDGGITDGKSEVPLTRALQLTHKENPRGTSCLVMFLTLLTRWTRDHLKHLFKVR